MFTPILDRVLLKRIEQDEEETKSGIVIPKAYREPSLKGEVVAIGQFVVMGGIRIPLSEVIKVGQTVRFSEFAIEKIEEDGEEYGIVRVQDIKGIHEKKRGRKN